MLELEVNLDDDNEDVEDEDVEDEDVEDDEDYEPEKDNKSNSNNLLLLY